MGLVNFETPDDLGYRVSDELLYIQIIASLRIDALRAEFKLEAGYMCVKVQ